MNADLDKEEVERRKDVRGLMQGLEIVLPGNRRVEALEASRKGLFAAIDDPDSMKLGDLIEIEVHRGERSFGCRTEIVRKEIHPRRGVVLRIIHLTPVAEETLKEILDEA
jgi:hypothetical protein